MLDIHRRHTDIIMKSFSLSHLQLQPQMCALVWRTTWWWQSSSLSPLCHSNYHENLGNYLENQSFELKKEFSHLFFERVTLLILFWKCRTDCRIKYWIWIYCERETLLLLVVMFSMWSQLPQSFFCAVVPHYNLSIIASCTHYEWVKTKSKKLIRNFFWNWTLYLPFPKLYKLSYLLSPFMQRENIFSD